MIHGLVFKTEDWPGMRMHRAKGADTVLRGLVWRVSGFLIQRPKKFNGLSLATCSRSQNEKARSQVGRGLLQGTVLTQRMAGLELTRSDMLLSAPGRGPARVSLSWNFSTAAVLRKKSDS